MQPLERQKNSGKGRSIVILTEKGNGFKGNEAEFSVRCEQRTVHIGFYLETNGEQPKEGILGASTIKFLK
jgi:hypothetical protein